MYVCIIVCPFCSAKVCSASIFETSFSYDIDIWIAATDYYMHFYTVMLCPLTAILQLINFTASYSSLLINVVILMLNCLVLVLYLYIHFLSLRCYFLYLKTIFGPLYK